MGIVVNTLLSSIHRRVNRVKSTAQRHSIIGIGIDPGILVIIQHTQTHTKGLYFIFYFLSSFLFFPFFIHIPLYLHSIDLRECFCWRRYRDYTHIGCSRYTFFPLSFYLLFSLTQPNSYSESLYHKSQRTLPGYDKRIQKKESEKKTGPACIYERVGARKYTARSRFSSKRVEREKKTMFIQQT